MSQQTRPSLQEYRDVSVEPSDGTPGIVGESPTSETAASPLSTPAHPSRLGTVLALVGIGLLLQGVADALARNGHESSALAPFLCGIAIQFAACAWRLTSARAERRERVWISVILGLGLFASYAMLQPLLLDSFDELDHLGTLFRVLDSHTLFPTNTVLPVSPYYPGLELATAATKWMTGLPLVIDQLLVLSIVRVVLVLGVFLIVERVCRSSRAGGIGVLVYAASPQFYGFDAQYAYETIGLAFAVGAVYFVFFSVDAPRPRMGKTFILALGSICAVVISHHVTGWLTVGFLVILVVGMYWTTHPLRHWRLAGRWPFGRARKTLPGEPGGGEPGASGELEASQELDGSLPAEPAAALPAVPVADSDDVLVRRRRTQTRIAGLAAVVGLAVGAAWTLFVFRLLTPYLGPIFDDAATEIRIALGNGHGDRALFKSSSGGTSPKWEILLILLAAAAWCITLLPSLYSVIFKRSVRGGGLRWIPAIIAATYPLSVVANVSSDSKLVAERATTFIFFGMAVVVGAWLAKRMARDRRLLERLGTLALATIIFLGSLLFGIGPLVSLLPGPYQVGADSLSYGAPSFALANWSATHLPAGSNVAADKDNGVLLNAMGGVNAVTAESGLVNPELLYFDRSLSLYDIYLIRKADIRYLVVDDRLARGRPLFGTYIADGEPPSRLTLPQLTKFNGYSFVKRIYDNGPIQVFDLTELLPPSERAAPAGSPAGGWGLNPGIFALAAVTGVLWAIRLRRRWRRTGDAAHLTLCVLLAALVIGVFSAFVVRITHASPEIVAAAVLGVLLLLSVRPPNWRLRRGPTASDADPPPGDGPDGGPDGGSDGSPDGDSTGVDGPAAFVRSNGDAPGHPEPNPRTDPRPVPRQTPVPAGAGAGATAVQVAVGSTFYERREVRDVLAYLRVLTDPDDTTSLRRIMNAPKRGIGPKSVSRLANWAKRNHVSLREAVDRAEEAGFQAQPAEGAADLSEILAELEPLVATATPAELVEQVLDRSGYRAALAADSSPEADGRLDNLTEMVARAQAFDDLDAFFAEVERDIAAHGLEPVPAALAASPPAEDATSDSATAPPQAAEVPPGSPRDSRPRWTGPRRAQVALGCAGVVLIVLGASVATAAERKDWTPPAELSISTSPTDKSVAQAQLGAAGPVPARLEVTNRGRTLWSSRLARTTTAQNVAIPSRVLHKGSRVRLITDGHTLRWVDGWVVNVPKPKSGGGGGASTGG